jgi:hypothetical protein
MVFWLFVIALFTPRLMAAEALDVNELQKEGQILSEVVYYYSGPESFDQVKEPAFQRRFTKGSQTLISFATLNPGFIPEQTQFWFRLSFKNSESKPKVIYLDGGQFPYKLVEVYDQHRLIDRLQTGEYDRERVVKLSIPANTISKFYLRVKPSLAIFFTVKVWYELSHYFQQQMKLNISNSVIGAIIVMSMLMNAMLLFAYRKVVYLYYLLYLAAFGLWLVSVWMMPWEPWGENSGVGFFAGLMAAFAVLFSIHFLDLYRYKLLLLQMRILLVVVFVGVLLCLWDEYQGFQYLQYASLVGTPLCLFCGMAVSLKSHQRHAYVYCVAYGSMLLGVCITILFNMGYLTSYWYRYGMQYGTTVETLIMLMAIGQRIWASESQRKHSYNQLAKVVFPHQLQMIKRNCSLETTMPVGEHEACVIAFDIIGSTKIRHPDFADRWEEFMSHCRNMMMDHYDGATLTSTAYLIKELGDGFLCSIGFPFNQVGPSKALSAFDLAKRIIRTFSDVMSKLDYSEPIYCSLEISRGQVKGYFYQSGSIRHDLWGPALVHATRYESVRKMIFHAKNLPSSHIIVLQDKVYESLSLEKRKELSCLNLKEAGFVVRDDPNAVFLAYLCVAEQDVGNLRQSGEELLSA